MVSVCVVGIGTYTYDGKEYKASASQSGSSFARCRKVILEALKINESCGYNECSFDGIWSGGGGAGQRNLYVSSLFFDKAAQVNPTPPSLEFSSWNFKHLSLKNIQFSPYIFNFMSIDSLTSHWTYLLDLWHVLTVFKINE